MRGRRGAARIALATRAPVLPVAQWGIQQMMGPRTKRFRPFPRPHVRLVVGAPIELDDLYGRDDDPDVVDLATERVMAAVTGLLEGLRGESAPPVRFDPTTMGS
jgi:1-acyl-sn-glycerol-3-phosphate acyltransferase